MQLNPLWVGVRPLSSCLSLPPFISTKKQKKKERGIKGPGTAAAVRRREQGSERQNGLDVWQNNINVVTEKLICSVYSFHQQLLWLIGWHPADSSVINSHAHLLLVFWLEFWLNEWKETLSCKLRAHNSQFMFFFFFFLPQCKVKPLGNIQLKLQELMTDLFLRRKDKTWVFKESSTNSGTGLINLGGLTIES